MEHTYTIPETRRAEMQKACAKFAKKAEEYGKVFSAVFGDMYVKEVDVYHDSGTHKEMIECFNLTLDAEVIRKDGYCVIAKIEHLPSGNFVTPFTDTIRKGWFDCPSYCAHCQSNRFRKNTFIVRSEHGVEKQVGSTCLKDYCGINPNIFAQYRELETYMEAAKIPEYVDEDYEYFGERLYDLHKALAFAYDLVDLYGYIRSSESSSNKSRLLLLLSSNNIAPSDVSLKKAEALIAECKELGNTGDYPPSLSDKAMWLIRNVRTLALNECCKESQLGFVAYAPIAYGIYQAEKTAWLVKEAEHKKVAQTSGFVGEPGDKITFKVAEMKLVSSWPNDYGRTTYLYRFVDADGNVLIWYASKHVGECNWEHVTAKVKNQNVRDDVRQTIVTNCKAI